MFESNDSYQSAISGVVCGIGFAFMSNNLGRYMDVSPRSDDDMSLNIAKDVMAISAASIISYKALDASSKYIDSDIAFYLGFAIGSLTSVFCYVGAEQFLAPESSPTKPFIVESDRRIERG